MSESIITDFYPRDETILKGLYPPFSEQIQHFMKYCWREGHPVHLSQGFRLFGEQDTLFRHGKSLKKGGESLHNYGVAIDIIFDNNPLAPGVQNPYHAAEDRWHNVANIGARCGLEPGYYWKSFQDKPHFQAKIKSKVGDLRKAFLKESFKGLWDFLDTHERESFILPPSAYT